jgi:uncharacterized damage-inducible protein DinB
MTRTVLHDAFDHHVWATIRVIDACLALAPEQLDTAVPGTYGSILETLRHLVSADTSYLWVLSDGRRPEIEAAEMGLAELRAVMEESAPAWTAVVDRDLDPEEVVIRHRDDGTDSHAPRSIRLAQVLHHGTDHRSQVCTALTSLGVEPPEIDVWDFAWKDGRIWESASAG